MIRLLFALCFYSFLRLFVIFLVIFGRMVYHRFRSAKTSFRMGFISEPFFYFTGLFSMTFEVLSACIDVFFGAIEIHHPRQGSVRFDSQQHFCLFFWRFNPGIQLRLFQLFFILLFFVDVINVVFYLFFGQNLRISLRLQ